MINNKKQKNITLSFLLMLLFCYPIFTIFNKKTFIGNIPILYIYIAVSWLVALIFLIISAEAKPFKKHQKNKNE